jgi:single-strand DNA-binding protein
MANINRVVIEGNLTRDPELRQLAGGNSVCKLRVAVNERVKDRESGQWSDKPNYFDVTVWGAQGESISRYLQKGSGIMIDGRLSWREWDAQDGTKRQSVEIIAENTRFVGGREGSGSGGYEGGRGGGNYGASDDFTPAPARTPASVPAADDDDDIPF